MRPSKEAVPESTTTGIWTYPKDVPASRNTRIERTGNGRIDDLGDILYHRYGDVTGMDSKLMDPWETCNSLRYGFDEEYDSPVFDDEDNTEEAETNE